MGFLPILLPFLEAVTGKRINPGGPKRPFQKTDEFGGQRPKKKTDKCAPKPDFPGRPPCVYSGVLESRAAVLGTSWAWRRKKGWGPSEDPLRRSSRRGGRGLWKTEQRA